MAKYRRLFAIWSPALTMLLVSLISYVDRGTLSLLAPAILKETGLNAQQYGYIIAAFSIAYTISNPVWGIVIDRIGLRRGMTVAVSWWTLASVAHAFAGGLWSFGLARAVLGLGEGATFPGGLRTVMQTLPPAQRGRGLAVAYSGGSLGALVTPLIVTPIFLWWGWRGAFWFTGLIGLLWLAVWSIVSRRPDIQATGKATPESPDPLPSAASTTPAPFSADRLPSPATATGPDIRATSKATAPPDRLPFATNPTSAPDPLPSAIDTTPAPSSTDPPSSAATLTRPDVRATGKVTTPESLDPATPTRPAPRFTDPSLWAFMCAYALGGLPLGFVLYAASLYLANPLGCSQELIGRILWIPPLGWEAGYFVWGWLQDRGRSPGAMMAWCSVVSLTLAAIPWMTSVAAVMAAMFLTMFVAAGFIVLSVAYATRVYSTSHSGLIAGTGAGSWSFLVALMMPYLGHLFDLQRHAEAFWIVSAVPLFGFTLWWFLSRAATRRILKTY